MAFYGPDERRASKVAVGIVRTEGSEPTELERWFSEADVRDDTGIGAAILAFLDRNGVKSVMVTDRIIGCPHEEGIDYPEREKCPKCRYWATRDRWSGDVLH